MGFIFGLIVGGALSSSSVPGVTQSLNQIPFACLAAFDESDAAYLECRIPSMWLELNNSSLCYDRSINRNDGACSLKKHIDWELAGLHQMKDAILQKRAESK